jgi:hypothetical protein
MSRENTLDDAQVYCPLTRTGDSLSGEAFSNSQPTTSILSGLADRQAILEAHLSIIRISIH